MVALSIKESRFCFDLLLIFSQTASFTIASPSDQLRTLREAGAQSPDELTLERRLSLHHDSADVRGCNRNQQLEQ
jgi:hypothetical protein